MPTLDLDRNFFVLKGVLNNFLKSFKTIDTILLKNDPPTDRDLNGKKCPLVKHNFAN